MGADAIDQHRTDGGLDAGEAAAWLAEIGRALRGEGETDVPCGSCTACCTSGQFVHVEPDERAALDRIPSALLAPAPGLPAGHVVLLHDEQGRCPMLGDGGCTIYTDRPRTCRVYDCRVFAAAEVALDDPRRRAIADRVAQWRFRVASDADRDALDAVRRASAHLADPSLGLPPGRRAVLAVELAHLFSAGEPDATVVRDAVDQLTGSSAPTRRTTPSP